MTDQKKPRKPRTRTAYEVAGRISGIIATAKQRRADDQSEIARLMLSLAESEREKVGALILAGGLDLCGFELGAANDIIDPGEPDDFPEEPPPAAKPAEGKVPEWANRPPPAGSRRIEVDR